MASTNENPGARAGAPRLENVQIQQGGQLQASRQPLVLQQAPPNDDPVQVLRLRALRRFAVPDTRASILAEHVFGAIPWEGAQ